MTVNYGTVTRTGAIGLIMSSVASAFGSAILVFAAFDGLWNWAVPGLLLLGVGLAGMWYALNYVAENRWEMFDAAMDTLDVLQGADRLRLRVIIHQALVSAIALIGDPDLADTEDLDYLTERTVDALIVTGPVYRRTDDG